jgi:uncharacterized delta-60 repeat protein
VPLTHFLLVARPRRLGAILAFCSCLATTVLGGFTDRSFEKLGVTSRALQRPDGNIWVIYEQPQDDHDIVDRFDVPGLFKTALVTNTGERVPGSDRLCELGNRFTYGFFAMATQADNKLLLGTETGEFFRLNADGSLDSAFNPQVSQVVGTVAVQSDGKILVAPELVRLNADGSRDSSFNAQLANESPGTITLQSSGKIVVAVGSAPYLKRLNPDGSADPTFAANLPAEIYSILRLPNDALLVRVFQFDSNGQTVFSLVRLNADGSNDPGFHPDSRFHEWFSAQSDGKVLAAFRESSTGNFFLGRMNGDGTLDSSFQIYPAGQLDNDASPISAAFVQPDGSILAEIISPTDGQQFLRFSSTGVLDLDSKVPFRIPAPLTKLAPQPDGKLLTGGDFNFVDRVKTGALVRFEADGNLDLGFHPQLLGATTTANDLDVQKDGGILSSILRIESGTAVYANERLTPTGDADSTFAFQNLDRVFKVGSGSKIITGEYYTGVRRLLSDGSIDPEFAPTVTYFDGNFGSFTAFAIQPDAKVVVVGNALFESGQFHAAPLKAAVRRLNATGGLDNTFVAPEFPVRSRFNCVALQPDGKVLLGGRFVFNDGSGVANLIRLNPDGSVDHTFVAAPDYTVSAILVERSGTIVIGGGFSSVNGQPAARVARLDSNGQLDPDFALDTRGGAVYALAQLGDGRIVAGGEFGLAISPALVPARLRNISSRMFVDTGDNALIAGIIVAGSGEKKLLARAIGPSLASAGIATPLADPVLELRDANGALLSSNDDWQQSPDTQAIIESGIPPGDPRESALIATLPGNGSTYTAVVRPARGASGIGLVELYDLDPPESSARLANLSSRGRVLEGDKAMISGFIVEGSASMGPVKVVLRGLGPTTLLSGVLQDPILELHDSSDAIGINDDWKQTQQPDIEASGIPPRDDRESVILRWVPLAPYTAVLRGKDNGTGIGLLEIYDVTK